jgi:hypothetical protein
VLRREGSAEGLGVGLAPAVELASSRGSQGEQRARRERAHRDLAQRVDAPRRRRPRVDLAAHDAALVPRRVARAPRVEGSARRECQRVRRAARDGADGLSLERAHERRRGAVATALAPLVAETELPLASLAPGEDAPSLIESEAVALADGDAAESHGTHAWQRGREGQRRLDVVAMAEHTPRAWLAGARADELLAERVQAARLIDEKRALLAALGGQCAGHRLHGVQKCGEECGRGADEIRCSARALAQRAGAKSPRSRVSIFWSDTHCADGKSDCELVARPSTPTRSTARSARPRGSDSEAAAGATRKR